MKRTIQNKEYDFQEKNIPVTNLRFWTDNPRIHAEVYGPYSDEEHSDDNEETQERVYQTLKKKDNVRNLRGKIEDQEGLTEPLIVRQRKGEHVYDVLEGNRRLAACLMILEKARLSPDSKENKKILDKFSDLPCEVVPTTMRESHIFSLLGILHIHGKDPWTPFAKASYVKRREVLLLRESGYDTSRARDVIRKELNETPREIDTLIGNINLMEDANEKNTDKYSFYDVLSRNRQARKHLADSGKKKIWIKAIKTWPEDNTAQEFRGAVRDTFANPRQLNRFIKGEIDLMEAAARSQKAGSTNDIYKKVKSFRSWLASNNSEIGKIDTTDPAFSKVLFEFDKLSSAAQKLNVKLKDKRDG